MTSTSMPLTPPSMFFQMHFFFLSPTHHWVCHVKSATLIIFLHSFKVIDFQIIYNHILSTWILLEEVIVLRMFCIRLMKQDIMDKLQSSCFVLRHLEKSYCIYSCPFYNAQNMFHRVCAKLKLCVIGTVENAYFAKQMSKVPFFSLSSQFFTTYNLLETEKTEALCMG